MSVLSCRSKIETNFTMIFLILGTGAAAVFNLTGIGYRKIHASDQSNTFILDRSLDTVFIFDSWSDSFLIKGLGLDMSEFSLMKPNSIGFVTYFLDEIEIVSRDTAQHRLQTFTLPKDFCHHKIAALSPFQKSTNVIHWNMMKTYFNLCFVAQTPEINASIQMSLTASTPATTAAYAGPDRYSDGEFDGERVPNGRSTTIELADGVIVRLHGATSRSVSEFETIVDPAEAEEWNNHALVALPYYFLPVETGYDYVSELGLGMESWETTLFTLSNAAIVGVTLSGASLLAIIISLLIFVKTLIGGRRALPQSVELCQNLT